MSPNMVPWIVLMLGAVAAGCCTVGVLTSRPESEPLFAMAGFVAAGGSLWAFASVLSTYGRFDAAVFAFLFAIAGFAGGYALASAILEGLKVPAKRPTRLAGLADQTSHKQSVIVLGEVEPPSYDVRAIAGNLKELAMRGALTASLALLPFVFLAQKLRYRAIGGSSPSAHELNSVAEQLANALQHENAGAVEAAWCRGERSLARVIADAVAGGSRAFAVAEAFIADTSQVDAAKREVDELHLAEQGITVSYTRPLWESERVARLVAARTMAVADTDDLARTGVALVGQAEPGVSAEFRCSSEAQETTFLHNVRSFLTELGLPGQNVRIAWVDWRSPDIVETLRHLGALGCRRIIVTPASFPLDSITTVLDIPMTARRASLDESVSIVSLSAWHDDPALVEALRADTLRVLEPGLDGSGEAPRNR